MSTAEDIKLLSYCNIAIQAGLKILDHYKKKLEIVKKLDKSPLTKADLDSNRIIIEGLKKIDNNIPILSEESLISWDIRKNWNKYWLIDPLDGTKEFINKNGEFTVNISLIENYKPVLGIIYAPTLSTLYYASKNKGSYKIYCDNTLNNFDKSKKINVSLKKISEHLLIIGSRSHSNDDFDNWVKENVNDYEIIKKGSSLKFCEIADGSVDIYPRFGPTSEWDIAAGHIILLEAKGAVYSLDNKEILYNTKKNLINPSFIASGINANE